MSAQKPIRRIVLPAIVFAASSLLLFGCPPGGGAPGKTDTKVSVLFGSNATPTSKAASSSLAKHDGHDGVNSLIASLTITVDQVSVDYAGTEPPNGGPVQTIDLLSSPIDVDLFHLDQTGLTQLLSDAQLPVGYYTAVHISFENARLVLQTDPDSPVVDITFSSQGEVTIEKQFQISDGAASLLIDFGGIHITIDSNGTLVITPNLTVECSHEDHNSNVEVTGQIDAIHRDQHSFEMSSHEDDLTVLYAAAAIYKLYDGDVPTGTPDDLQPHITVRVVGTHTHDGPVTASRIRIVETSTHVHKSGLTFAVHRDENTFEMSSDEDNFVVDYSNAHIFLPTDGDTSHGEPADLATGQHVEVFGTRSNDGPIVATKVRILPDNTEFHKVGKIYAFHPNDDQFEFQSGDNHAAVFYTGADIFLSTDGDTPTGTESDLAVGLVVDVRGTRTGDGPVTATKVRILDVHEDD